MFKKFTEPNLIYGIVIGVVFSILASFLLTTQAFNYGFLGVLVIASAFLAGVILGTMSLQYLRKKTQRGAQDLLPELGDLATKIGWSYVQQRGNAADAQHAHEFLQQTTLFKQKLGELSEWVASAYMRVTAFGALFTILGTMISFAVFWATFLQVSKLEEQIAQSKTATKIDIALNVSNSYQVLVNALIQDIERHNKSDNISDTLYQRIESTLYQLKPYYGIDIKTSELSTERNSPEQAFLLQYLTSLDIGFPSNKIQLSYLKAKGMDIRDADFSGANLYASDFARSHFYKSIFDNSNMAYTNMEGVKFQACELQGVDFSNAKLKGAEFSNSDISNAKLDNADLSGADLNNIEGWRKIQSIKGASIKGVKNAPKGFVDWAVKHGAVE